MRTFVVGDVVRFIPKRRESAGMDQMDGEYLVTRVEDVDQENQDAVAHRQSLQIDGPGTRGRSDFGIWYSAWWFDETLPDYFTMRTE